MQLNSVSLNIFFAGVVNRILVVFNSFIIALQTSRALTQFREPRGGPLHKVSFCYSRSTLSICMGELEVTFENQIYLFNQYLYMIKQFIRLKDSNTMNNILRT